MKLIWLLSYMYTGHGIAMAKRRVVGSSKFTIGPLKPRLISTRITQTTLNYVAHVQTASRGLFVCNLVYSDKVCEKPNSIDNQTV